MALLKQKKFKDSWLNSPNAYSKVELEETGTTQPKKYTTVRLYRLPNDASELSKESWEDFGKTNLAILISLKLGLCHSLVHSLVRSTRSHRRACSLTRSRTSGLGSDCVRIDVPIKAIVALSAIVLIVELWFHYSGWKDPRPIQTRRWEWKTPTLSHHWVKTPKNYGKPTRRSRRIGEISGKLTT